MVFSAENLLFWFVSVKIYSNFTCKEAAPKSSVYGGVNTFSNKKGLVGRMTMIQSALDSSDLGEYFRYPQRHEKVYRKFFRDV